MNDETIPDPSIASVYRALALSEIAYRDRLCEVLSGLHFFRMSTSRTAAYFGISIEEVTAARAYELANGNDVFRARADWTRRNSPRVLRHLSESMTAEIKPASGDELTAWARKILTLAATDRIAAWRHIDVSLAGGRSEYAQRVLAMIEAGPAGDATLTAGIAVAIDRGWPERLRRRLS